MIYAEHYVDISGVDITYIPNLDVDRQHLANLGLLLISLDTHDLKIWSAQSQFKNLLVTIAVRMSIVRQPIAIHINGA